MSLPIKQRRGRQRGGRHLYGTSRRSTVRNHILIDDELKNLIEAYRQPEEIINEALWRMIREHNKTRIELRKKVDALLLQIEEAPIKVIQQKHMEISSQYEL